MPRGQASRSEHRIGGLSSASPGGLRPKSGQLRPLPGQVGPGFAEFAPRSVELGPSLIEIGPVMLPATDFAGHCSNPAEALSIPGRIRPNSAQFAVRQILVRSGPTRSMLVRSRSQISAHLSRCRATSTRTGKLPPKLRGRRSGTRITPRSIFSGLCCGPWLRQQTQALPSGDRPTGRDKASRSRCVVRCARARAPPGADARPRRLRLRLRPGGGDQRDHQDRRARARARGCVCGVRAL